MYTIYYFKNNIYFNKKYYNININFVLQNSRGILKGVFVWE